MSEDLKILYFGNNYVSYQILKFLKKENENIIGLVVHPEGRAKYRAKSIDLFRDKPVIEGDKLRESETINQVKILAPDIIISIYFGYILKPEILNIPPRGSINLHPAYLPYNRGAHPNVWSIVDETTPGTTLHYMDEGIDTGKIIARKSLPPDFKDTGKTLYQKLEALSIELFKETWPLIKANKIQTIEPKEKATYHYVKDLATLNEIDPNKEYKAIDLINILRARTFPPYRSSYMEIEGKRYYIEVNIKKEKDFRWSD